MMLRTNTGMLPGGIIFQDPRVPSMKWTDTHTFLDDRAKEVIKFRTANPAVYNPVKDAKYLDFENVRLEVASYNCQRVGNNPLYCLDEKNPVQTRVKTAVSKCDCGVPLEERLCPTCSGHRVIGLRCPKCGLNFDLP